MKEKVSNAKMYALYSNKSELKALQDLAIINNKGYSREESYRGVT